MLIKHSSLYLIGRIVPGVVSFLSLAMLTRFLTPEQYGNYALVIAAVGVINAIFFQWLGISVVRFYPAHQENPGRLMSTVLFSFAVVIIAILILGISVLFFVKSLDGRLIIFCVILTCSQAWFDINLRITNAKLEPITYGMQTSVKAIISIVLAYGFLIGNFGLYGVFSGIVVSLLIPPIFLKKYWKNCERTCVDISLFNQLFRYGSPLTITFLLSLVIDASDRFFLAWIVGAKAVGSYAPAYDLAQQSLGVLMVVVHLAAFPLVVKKLEEHGVEAAQEQIRKNCLVFWGISLPATAGLIVLAPDLVFYIIGDGFQENAVLIIQLIAISAFLSGLRTFYYDYSFQLGKRLMGQIWAALAGALVNVVGNFFLIPSYGVIGAAISTLLAFFVALIVTINLGAKVFPLPKLNKEIWKVAISSLCMLLALSPWYETNFNYLPLKVFFGAAFYFLNIFIFNAGNFRGIILLRLSKKRSSGNEIY